MNQPNLTTDGTYTGSMYAAVIFRSRPNPAVTTPAAMIFATCLSTVLSNLDWDWKEQCMSCYHSGCSVFCGGSWCPSMSPLSHKTAFVRWRTIALWEVRRPRPPRTNRPPPSSPQNFQMDPLPDGWTMPVCEIDLRVGGVYRYVWRKESTGKEMGMGGVFREVVRPERLVATEKFDDSWNPGEALDTTMFEESGGITIVKLTVLYE